MNYNEAKQYLKEHKKEILIGTGAFVVAVAGGVVAYRFLGRNGTRAVMGVVEVTEEVTQPQMLRQIGVSQHIRNLPSGWNPSVEKLEEAALLGISLSEGQTIVDPFVRVVAA